MRHAVFICNVLSAEKLFIEKSFVNFNDGWSAMRTGERVAGFDQFIAQINGLLGV